MKLVRSANAHPSRTQQAVVNPLHNHVAGKANTLSGVNAGGGQIFLVDDFLTTESAPLTSPRGSGFVINDTTNVWSITSGELTPSAASLGTNNPGIWHVNGFGRVTGRTLKVRMKNVSAYGVDANKTFSPMAIWGDTAGATSPVDFEGISYWVANTKFQILDSIAATSWATLETCLADTYNVFAVILRAGGGAFHVVDGKLIGITRQNADSNVHPNVGSLGGSRNPPQVDYMRVGDMASPWNTDFGICTSALTGARSVSDTFTHEGACHIEFTVTALPSVGNVFIHFRKVDANNYWRINIGTTGTISIDEVVAGTPTARASISSCAVSDRMIISMNGATINMYRDRPATGVTNSAAYGAALYPSATAGEINSLGTGGGISELYAYPYNLSGSALAAINNL